MSEKITCKKCKDREKQEGCSICGGYGYIAIEAKCPTCERTGLFRPGVYTHYEGKRYHSIDGLEMVAHMGGESNCVYCEGKK